MNTTPPPFANLITTIRAKMEEKGIVFSHTTVFVSARNSRFNAIVILILNEKIFTTITTCVNEICNIDYHTYFA